MINTCLPAGVLRADVRCSIPGPCRALMSLSSWVFWASVAVSSFHTMGMAPIGFWQIFITGQGRAGQGSKENRESRKHKLTESLDSRENKQREPGENTEGCFYLRKVVHDELLEGLVRDPVIAIQHGLKSGNGSPRSLPGIKGLTI